MKGGSYISYKNILSIAWPMMLGSLGQNIVQLVNTAFLGRLGEATLGGAALGGIFYFVLFLVGFGFNNGMQVMVARRNGEKNYLAVGEVLDHQIILILLLAAIEFVVMRFLTAEFFPLFLHNADIRNEALRFLQTRSFGILCGLFNSTIMCFYIGINDTKVTVYSTVAMTVTNVILDYTLIFGHFGFPQMGIAGAGISSVVAEGVVTIILLIYIFNKKYPKQFGFFRLQKFKSKLAAAMIRVSAPLIFQQLISVSSWFLFFVLIEEYLGEQPLAISNLARSLYMLVGMPLWALASTTNSMTGNLLGQGNANEVIPLLKKIVGVAFIYSFSLGVVMNLIPQLVLHIYSSDEALIAASISTVRVITIATVGMAVAINTIYCVSGTGATRQALMIEIACITSYLLYVWITVILFTTSLPVVWFAEVLYWIVAFTLCAMYLRHGEWQTKKV